MSALAIPTVSSASTDGGHNYFVGPLEPQTEYKHEAFGWQEGEAQYNGECYECGNDLVYVGWRGGGSKDNYGFTHYIWGNVGAITGYVDQYDIVNPGASHTIWGWFAT